MAGPSKSMDCGYPSDAGDPAAHNYRPSQPESSQNDGLPGKLHRKMEGDSDSSDPTMDQVYRALDSRHQPQNRDGTRIQSLARQTGPDQSILPRATLGMRANFEPRTPARGEEVEPSLALCPFKLVQAYPYRFVGKARGEQAVEWFKAHLFNRSWDMYYIHDPYSRRDPLILVPTAQLAQLLRDLNSDLGFHLRIPDKQDGRQFEVYFQATPGPRFMGRIESDEAYREAKETMGHAGDLSQLDPKAMDLFRKKMDGIYDSLKTAKSRKDPEKQRAKMIARQKSWGQTIKRAQRYLGLRQRQSLVPYSDATDVRWNVHLAAPFEMENSVRFVCVDVEANELNPWMVTEIGLAILDTEDIEDVSPGENGENWIARVQAHHLRVNEYRSHVNSKYIQGCPDEFDFGKSEFVPEKDVCRRLGELIGESESKYKSKVVMVGHEAIADLKYLEGLGYNMWNLDTLLDEIDTKGMFQRIQRSTDGRSLGFVCSELGIPGHHFHNAGNDAVYTLRAMITMAVGKKAGGPLTESERSGWVPEAKLNEWSDGEQDDGGVPVKTRAASRQPARSEW